MRALCLPVFLDSYAAFLVYVRNIPANLIDTPLCHRYVCAWPVSDLAYAQPNRGITMSKADVHTIKIGERSFASRKGVDGADGTWRRRKNGILFLDHTGSPRSFLVINQFGERFFVTASKDQSSGRTRFMYGLAEDDRSFMGLPSSLSQARAIAEEIALQVA